MDFTYYNQDCVVEVYAGKLKREGELREEKHPLIWFDADGDFFDEEGLRGRRQHRPHGNAGSHIRNGEEAVKKSTYIRDDGYSQKKQAAP